MTKQPYSYDGLDRVLHEKTRLQILSALAATAEGHDFHDLKTLCALTDGNLSRHLQVLKDEGLLEVDKSYENNRPHTHVSLTEAGRARFMSYIDALEAVVRNARGN